MKNTQRLAQYTRDNHKMCSPDQIDQTLKMNDWMPDELQPLIDVLKNITCDDEQKQQRLKTIIKIIRKHLD